ncbi:16S rRNA (guanine(527)-N(7))-methyltransferase RsmG [Legionella spiritensis]|uniref:Ribosomal RNA small subunit methyltransferase G n=1 Tax=Legionella spiritensis TaxID=452 RepID=A0A0W0YWA6_LEGSP|nr:16S rRNA (guanine(527)-N(7))-methyltransferase RsmG [Legionella spiritensis]KTD61178.1 glucose inhibited division protein B GidB [Legionella spiritensis]SNV28495.1 glucose inhibited division protein B GidB [Legionella spiritensis]
MTSTQQSTRLLQQGLSQLGLPDHSDALLTYLSLLNKWNHVYNLTAVREIPAMVSRHVLDSLAVLPFIRGARIVDVGSGAGLPGIPLAIARPQTRVTLLDSNGKKTRFLEEVQRHLMLDNVEVIQSRIENYHPAQAFDTVISRAFSDLAQMIHWTKHVIDAHGIWLAMKGRYPQTELSMIDFPYQVHRYDVPGLDEERCSVIIENKTEE